MPTMRRMLSGVASALFIARRIQAGLAANIRPSSTNRTPTPMRKSANAMDLIGLEPPVGYCFWRWHRGRSDDRFGPLNPAQGFAAAAGAGVAAAAVAAGAPEGPLKNLKKSESGR